MRKDQIFVLMLIILVPMSGCFDGGTAGVGEAEGAQDNGGENTPSTGTSTTVATPNLPPVISVETIGYLENVEGDDCTTNAFEIEVRHAMTDWDGSIVNAGWDINLDGIIDYPTNSSEGYMMVEIPMNTMVSRTSVSTGSSYEYEYREQSIVFGAQDDDGAWTSSSLIKLSRTISYTSTNTGVKTSYIDIEPCSDFSDVRDYTFSIVDHSDTISDGTSDYLVEISRTNGQHGLDWSRIRIIFEGDQGGDETCSITNTRCKIIEQSSLWEAGSTITLQEGTYLHDGVEDAEIKIYIDDILVKSLSINLQ